MNTEELYTYYLVYVKLSYVNTDNTYVYDFFFSATPDIVWGLDWEINNPLSCTDLTPDPSTYSIIKRIQTKMPLKTIEETSCYSMEHAIPRIIALAWINIENLEEYPENGRMVFHFGDTMDEVKELLKKYDIELV